MRLRTWFWWSLGASLVPMYLLVLYGQRHWGFDNIGTWYTVYCTVGFSLVLAIVVVALVALVGITRK